MGKKIECYIDCGNDAVAIVRTTQLTRLGYRFFPVFLGGINVGSGNKPPWTNAQKAAYAQYDGKRAQQYFGHAFEVPSFFPILSLLPQRAMTYVKQRYSNDRYELAFLRCFETMWNGQLDISIPDNLCTALLKLFNPDEVQEILQAASSPEIKEALTKMTDKAVRELGAFGCPWFWVHDGKGNAEPFFGSDRFHFMWNYLGLPHEDLKLIVGAKLIIDTMYTLSSWLLLTGAVAARVCENRTIDITVSAQNAVFNNLTTPKTNEEATGFAVDASTQGFNATDQALTGYASITGPYKLSTQYCSPNGRTSGPAPVLQILTHGFGYDKVYWDLPYNAYNYSYIDDALSLGYATLSYDRLGIGNSSHGDAKSEIQTPLEVAALAQLIDMVRNGSYPGIIVPRKVILIGHSYGSVQTYDLTATDPSSADAIVLTGFSLNQTFSPSFIAGGNWQQAYLTQKSAYNYTPGYLASGNINADQYLFCHWPEFDPSLLAYVETIKQPVTVGELLTIGSVPAQNPFAGPVLLISGSNDVPFCGGDCYNTGGGAPSIPSDAAKAFPNARPFEAFVQPNTGHAINLHYTAKEAYNFMFVFLATNGLGP
ncbi:hypothetical protein AOCH_002275 [Aspergillus ochraceoroseus]|uniref:Glutathione S-transferase kappa 1 n=1 Tax=Aspergillus ochraceoroseus TaxID=138278 RepID=A0A0F8W3W0_9EURO|nr:hypothetical protein AOCH_002275 [Aspergillus ochraceoroseus]